jgi:hypothetical protein
MHAKYLRKWIDDKVPALNEGRTTDTSIESETHSDADGTQKTSKTSVEVTEVKPKTDLPSAIPEPTKAP